MSELDVTLSNLCCLRDDNWLLAVIQMDRFPSMLFCGPDLAVKCKEIIERNFKTNTTISFRLIVEFSFLKFALLINSNQNLEESKSILNDLIEKIHAAIPEIHKRKNVGDDSTNCKIGIGKMNVNSQHWDWIEWKQRVFGYVEILKKSDPDPVDYYNNRENKTIKDIINVYMILCDICLIAIHCALQLCTPYANSHYLENCTITT